MSAAVDSKLPADPEVPGNAWCDVCQQSLQASRASAHLASKKHAENAGRAKAPAPAPKATRAAAKAKPAEPADDFDGDAPRPAKKRTTKVERPDSSANPPEKAPRHRAEPARQEAPPRQKAPARAKEALPGHGLREDPSKPGNFYCGICRVSLTPAKADVHLDTARHQANEEKTLNSAINNLALGEEY